MTRAEAALIRAWIKSEKDSFKSFPSDPWARGYKQALANLANVIRKIQDGKTDIKDLV